MMLAGYEGSEFIPRDAVFATAAIILNGLIGLCIFINGRQHYEMDFRSDVATSSLLVLATLVTFTLVM
jgi:Ca2+:H+ antiporter